MTTQWGAVDGHIRVGVDVSMSPETVAADTQWVTLTYTFTVQTVNWYFADNQTLVLAGAISESIDYRKADPSKSGTYDTLIGTRKVMVETSTSAPIVKQQRATVTGIASGGSPSVSVSTTIPQRPAAGATTSTPATSTPAAASGTYKLVSGPANVRSAPSTSAVVVASINVGTMLTGTITDGWLRIDSGTYAGRYVFGELVELVSAAPSSSTTTTPSTATDTPASSVTPTPTDTPASEWTPPVADTPAPIPQDQAAGPPPPIDPPSNLDVVPSVGVMVWGSGDYDAFPRTAAHDDVVLTAWRHATAHDVDRQGSLMASVSRDGGRTYATPWVLPIAKVADSAPGVGGLAWDEKNQQWVMSVIWARYAAAPSRTVLERWVEIRTSADDGQTWSTPRRIPTPSANWFYGNDIAIDGDLWVVAGYGAMQGQADMSLWQCLTVTSTDAGATWAAVLPVAGIPAGSSWAEPNVIKLPSGAWLMTMRAGGATVEIHRSVSLDGVHWSYLGIAVAGYTGNPNIIALPNGAILMLARTPNDVDPTQGPGYSLGRWAWGYSLDSGATWSMRPDFSDQIRRNVYGAMALTDSGGVAVVYASEDDPDKPWKTASVWYSRFVTQKLVVENGFVGPVSAIDVSTADRIPITRIWRDRWTGEELVDKVRWRSLDGFTSRDFEVQQGQTVTYRAGNRVTGEIVGPILPHIILVHPLYPELSVPIEVTTDGDRTYKLDAQVTEIPGSPYAIVTKSGGRKVRSPYGETKFRTRTLEDKEKVRRLFEDGSPLFVSHHPGADFPDWVQPLEELQDGRVVQTCGHPDHGNGIGEWRDWSFKWVAIRRPSTAGMPVRRRWQDVQQTFQATPIPFQEM